MLTSVHQYNAIGQPSRTETLMKDGPSRVTTYVYGTTGTTNFDRIVEAVVTPAIT